MLSACGALVLVTWLPQFDTEVAAEKHRDINKEHLAAASAYVQNFLILLTAANLGTYWSSGGHFRRTEMFERLGMPTNERLIAAVFVDYLHDAPEMGSPQGLEKIPGKHRQNRSPASVWTRHVSVEVDSKSTDN